VLAIADQFIDLPILAFCLQPDSLEHATMYLHLAIYASVSGTGRRPRIAPRRWGWGRGGRARGADVRPGIAPAPVPIRVPRRARGPLPLAAAARGGSVPRRHSRPVEELRRGGGAVCVGAAPGRVVHGRFALLVTSWCRGVAGSTAMRSAVACATEGSGHAKLQFSCAIAVVWVTTTYPRGPEQSRPQIQDNERRGHVAATHPARLLPHDRGAPESTLALGPSATAALSIGRTWCRAGKERYGGGRRIGPTWKCRCWWRGRRWRRDAPRARAGRRKVLREP